jgi:hypothetical protein
MNSDGLSPQLTRFESNGKVDATLPLRGFSTAFQSVSGLVWQSDNALIVAGTGEEWNGIVIRIQADLSIDSSFPNRSGQFGDSPWLSGSINAIAVQPDGKILLAGYSIAIGGVERNSIARLHADGSLDLSFDSGSGPLTSGSFGGYSPGWVYAMAPLPDSRIALLGSFVIFNGVPSSGVAVLHTEPPLKFLAPAVMGRQPVFRLTSRPGQKVRIEFDHIAGGLLAKGGELRGFAIAGEDGRWVWAKAEIQGKNKVAVSSPDVPKPVAVRYGWADFPVVNLWNKDGLPAVPFRTDSWKGVTEGK